MSAQHVELSRVNKVVSIVHDIKASLPVTALVDQFYKDVQKMGGGRWDTSSLFKRLQRD